MIDIENEVFTEIAKLFRKEYPEGYITGEEIKVPSKFPCVSLIEENSATYRKSQTSGNLENHARVLYKLDVFSAKESGKKTECKQILALLDEQMQKLGFTRIMKNPIPNEDKNKSIYRMVARYRAVVSKEKIIYRR